MGAPVETLTPFLQGLLFFRRIYKVYNERKESLCVHMDLCFLNSEKSLAGKIQNFIKGKK